MPAQYNTSFFRGEFHSSSCTFVQYIPPNFPFEKVLEPAFWVHVGDMLKAWMTIEVRVEDMSSKAVLTVIEAGHLFAKVALERQVDLIAKSEDPAALEVEFSGGKHRVRRGRDVLKDGFATKKDAERWIEDYAGKKAA